MSKIIKLSDDKIVLKEFADHLENKYSPETIKKWNDNAEEQKRLFRENNLSENIYERSLQIIKIIQKYLFLKKYNMISVAAGETMNFYENYIKTSNFDKRFEGRSLQINFDDDFNKDKIIQDMLNKMEISIKEKDIENYYYYLLCLTFCH